MYESLGVSGAIADAVRKLQRLRVPPSISLDTPVTEADIIVRKHLILNVAKICGDIVAAVASEAAEHSNQISRSEFVSVARDVLHDQSMLAQFDDAIEELEEIAAEEREPEGSARAGEKAGPSDVQACLKMLARINKAASR